MDDEAPPTRPAAESGAETATAEPFFPDDGFDGDPEGPIVVPNFVNDSADLGVSPDGIYRLSLSSAHVEGEEGGRTQPVVVWDVGSGSTVGVGLASVPFPRVPMRATWTAAHELVLSYPDDLAFDHAELDEWHNRSVGPWRVIYRAVPRAEVPEPTWSRYVDASVALEPRERGMLGEHTIDGVRTYAFTYADPREPDSSVAWLQERGYQGSGETWVGILYGLIMRYEPSMWPRLELDPESDSVRVMSTDKEAIVAVARLVARAKREPAELEAAIERAVRDGAMIE